VESHTRSTQHGTFLMLQVAPGGRAAAPSPGRQHFAAAAAAESSPPQKRQRPGSGGAAGAKGEEGDALPPIFHEAASSIGADIQICAFAYLAATRICKPRDFSTALHIVHIHYSNA